MKTFYLSAVVALSILSCHASPCSTNDEDYSSPAKEALSFIVKGEDIDKIQLTPLLGGGSNSKIFRVDIGDEKYVLRLLSENQPIERRRSELNAHQIGAELQIAPKIIYVDPALTVMVMEFIEGRTLNRNDLNNVEIVKEVMKALKAFHQHPHEESLIRRTKVEAIEDLYDRYKNKKGVVFPSCFDQLYRNLQADFTDLKREYGPSHGDFNPRNILVTDQGRIYIIDWDQASVDHPFLDIAWLSTFLAANNEQTKSLLKEYLGRTPNELELNETLFFKDVATFVVATLWIGRQEERSQDKLDSILEGDLKKGSAYIKEGISVEDVLQKKGMGLTLYSLGWLKEFINNRSSSHNKTNESSLKAVIFDCGGVVAEANQETMISFISNGLHLSHEEAAKAYCDYRTSENFKQFWTAYAQEYAISLPSNWNEHLIQAWVDAFEFNPGIIEIIQNLKTEGVQVAMLSNATPDQVVIVREKGLYAPFDPVLLSCEIGIKKPDIEAFRLLLNQLNLNANECLFIDDDIRNVIVARSLGIDSIHFLGIAQLKRELENRDISN